MRTARLTAIAAALILTTACASESAVAPQPLRASATAELTGLSHVPLLYVVDDVRQPASTALEIDPSMVASITVLKGRAALLKYGPDASYGVVIIRTKKATAQTD
ncbi:MAG TPA: TonB-dependent receptor plug domain-containing protein [Gemmatimonadaceae bacterium]|nr:TonB-dependent receptor plug domain-containing protein [Gemmatimonadaceae bacterium]